MPLTYRNNGPWGTGKGARLTSLEADGNVHDLDSRLEALEQNPPEALGIDRFTVSGSALTVIMTDGSTRGPLTLPTARFRWAGEWQPMTNYFALDIFAQGGSIYLVTHDHISDASFSPAAEDVAGFRYARLIAPPDPPYDIAMFYGLPIPGDGSLLVQHVAARSFVLPLGFVGSVAFLRVAVSTDILLGIYNNADPIGQIAFQPGNGLVPGDSGQFGSFTPVDPAAEIEFSRTDRLIIRAPDMADETAEGLSVTFAARAGTIA